MELIKQEHEKREYPVIEAKYFVQSAQQLRQFYHYMIQNELTESICEQSNHVSNMIKDYHNQEYNMWKYVGKACLKASSLTALLICIDIPIWYQNLFKDPENLIVLRESQVGLRGGIHGVLCSSGHQEYQYIAENMNPRHYGDYEICATTQQDYNQIIQYLNQQRIPVSGESNDEWADGSHKKWYRNWFYFWETDFSAMGMARLIREGCLSIPYAVQQEMGLNGSELLAKLQQYQDHQVMLYQELWKWKDRSGSSTGHWLRSLFKPFEQVQDKGVIGTKEMKNIVKQLEQKYTKEYNQSSRQENKIWESWPQGQSGSYQRQIWVEFARAYLEQARVQKNQQVAKQGMVYVTRIGKSYPERSRVMIVGFDKKYLDRYKPALWIQKDLEQRVSFGVRGYTFKEWLMRNGLGFKHIKEIIITQKAEQFTEPIWGCYAVKKVDKRSQKSVYKEGYSPIVQLAAKGEQTKYRLSASSLAIYKLCPRKFDLKYRRGYQGQVKGVKYEWPWQSIREKSNWIHRQLAKIGNNTRFQRLPGEEQVTWAQQEIQNKLEEYRVLWKGREQVFKWWCQNQIIAPMVEVIKQFGRDLARVACEEAFEITRVGKSFDVVGRIDRLEQSQSEIKIIDYKWKQGSAVPKLSKSLYWQMDVYIWAYSQKYPQYRITGEYWFIGIQGVVYKVAIKDQTRSIQEVDKKVQIIDELLREGYFQTGGKNPQSKSVPCISCEYQLACQRIENSEDTLDSKNTKRYQELEG